MGATLTEQRRVSDEGLRIVKKCFVRLACVKHAASVHPEPGSNSLIKFDLQLKTTVWLSLVFTV